MSDAKLVDRAIVLSPTHYPAISSLRPPLDTHDYPHDGEHLTHLKDSTYYINCTTFIYQTFLSSSSTSTSIKSTSSL